MYNFIYSPSLRFENGGAYDIHKIRFAKFYNVKVVGFSLLDLNIKKTYICDLTKV